MTQTQLTIIAVALVAIAVLSALLGRRQGWGGRRALTLALVPLAGLGLCVVFC